MKWFICYDTNSVWKIHMYFKAVPLAVPNLHCVHWDSSSLISVGWSVWTVESLPQNRAGRSLSIIATLTRASETFFRPLSFTASFTVHNTGHRCPDPALMPHLLPITFRLPSSAFLSLRNLPRRAYFHLAFHCLDDPEYIIFFQSSFAPIGFLFRQN